jgi:hypothetical protein
MAKNSLLAGLVILMFLAARPGYCEPWGPWSTSTDAPTLFTPADRERPARVVEPEIHPIAATPFLWMLWMYQRHITHIDGDRCPMYPTCSQYSVQAIHKHGPLMGIVMTADRLIHEADEQKYAYLTKIGNRYRYLDPVEDNDYWWYRK